MVVVDVGVGALGDADAAAVDGNVKHLVLTKLPLGVGLGVRAHEDVVRALAVPRPFS